MNGKTIAIYASSILAVVALIVFAVKAPVASPNPPSSGPESPVAEAPGTVQTTSSQTRQVAMTCTTDMATKFHIHPMLAIVIDGTRQEIPANIGITNGCMHPLHTHDGTGKIHVESPVKLDFTLGDFFAVWGKPFDREHLLDKTAADSSHRIRMTVDGRDSDQFENLVVEDGQVIVLYYEAVGK